VTPPDEGTLLDAECESDEDCLPHLAATHEFSLCIPG
jgi:hypothetical protein